MDIIDTGHMLGILSDIWKREVERQRPLDPEAFGDEDRVDREYFRFERDVLLAIVRKVIDGDYADALDNGMDMAEYCATEHVRNLRH